MLRLNETLSHAFIISLRIERFLAFLTWSGSLFHVFSDRLKSFQALTNFRTLVTNKNRFLSAL